jgi:hypothetical protein
MQGVMKISDRQQSLFEIEQYAIETIDRVGDSVGDYYWDKAAVGLLPNSPTRQPQHLQLLTFKSEQPQIADPQIREQTHADRLLDPPTSPLLPKKGEQPSTRELLTFFREQGDAIVIVNGKNYYLTHSKSSKYYPGDKGWFDIKRKGSADYLYRRWRDGVKQKSRCLGRVDRLE